MRRSRQRTGYVLARARLVITVTVFDYEILNATRVCIYRQEYMFEQVRGRA